MTDSRASENDLPWLQEVEDENAPRGISARRMLVGLVIVLLAAAAIAGGFFWLGQRDPAVPGPPELIRAPEGPYKVKPQDPGGLDVTGESETAFETSAGQDVDSRLAVGDDGPPAVPEQAEPKAPPGETREPVRATEPAAPPASSGAPGSVIQLGAYKNTAQAERAWTALSSRFEALGSMTKMIVPYSAGGSSGYRLRAAASSPAQAKEACNALQTAGESCFIAR